MKLDLPAPGTPGAKMKMVRAAAPDRARGSFTPIAEHLTCRVRHALRFPSIASRSRLGQIDLKFVLGTNLDLAPIIL